MGMPIAFFEVVSDDHERAQKFYAALFDWQVAVDPGMSVVGDGCCGAAVHGGDGGRRAREGLRRLERLQRSPHPRAGVALQRAGLGRRGVHPSLFL